MAQVVLAPSEFAEDLEVNLGRANGNIYQRKPGVPGVHDGQIMVRLKKKRFIIIDYSIVPTNEDTQAAELSSHIHIPIGAGKQSCTQSDCPKIGVPALLWDSDPNEPASLYLRSGLCFTCQRNLNEKRRTERKRTSKSGDQSSADSPSLIYAMGPCNKKFKLNGNTIQLKSDAIIINGAVEGTRQYGEGYGFQEIGADLQHLAKEASDDAGRLINAVSSSTATVAAAVAAVGDATTPTTAGEQELISTSTEAAANAVADAVAEASNSLLNPTRAAGVESAPSAPPSNADISALYDKAFHSFNKAIFLLSQWKASWDAAVSVAHETVADPSLADAVASAAAVAAAVTDGQDQNSNMVSLLLAADKNEEAGATAIGVDGVANVVEMAGV